MPIAMKLGSARALLHRTPPASPQPTGEERTQVARDFALLLGAALTTGVTAAVGMVLAVLVLA